MYIMQLQFDGQTPQPTLPAASLWKLFTATLRPLSAICLLFLQLKWWHSGCVDKSGVCHGLDYHFTVLTDDVSTDFTPVFCVFFKHHLINDNILRKLPFSQPNRFYLILGVTFSIWNHSVEPQGNWRLILFLWFCVQLYWNSLWFFFFNFNNIDLWFLLCIPAIVLDSLYGFLLFVCISLRICLPLAPLSLTHRKICLVFVIHRYQHCKLYTAKAAWVHMDVWSDQWTSDALVLRLNQKFI